LRLEKQQLRSTCLTCLTQTEASTLDESAVNRTVRCCTRAVAEQKRTLLTRHGLQKWWPHGVDTGCVGSCLQMPHVNWLSARSASLTCRREHTVLSGQSLNSWGSFMSPDLVGTHVPVHLLSSNRRAGCVHAPHPHGLPFHLGNAGGHRYGGR